MWYTYKKYIDENEEIRCWFKVSENRKKIRNVELWLLEELKKICKKHNIKYYAEWWTLLWAIRHKWFIPWDDDIDLVMFREDYEKFLEIAKKELPNYIEVYENHLWFSRISNVNTAAFWSDNRWDNDFIWGICIDIFPIDHASRSTIINYVKSTILRFLRIIMLSKKSFWSINKLKKWKKFFAYICKFTLGRINYSKLHKIHEKISKKVIFKGEDIYTGRCPWLYYPKNIFDKSHSAKFEKTTICIPDWYDEYLKITYGDYMKPVIFSWWHNCRYSVDKSYKDIIKIFDRSMSNEQNYNNCKDLFLL